MQWATWLTGKLWDQAGERARSPGLTPGEMAAGPNFLLVPIFLGPNFLLVPIFIGPNFFWSQLSQVIRLATLETSVYRSSSFLILVSGQVPQPIGLSEAANLSWFFPRVAFVLGRSLNLSLQKEVEGEAAQFGDIVQVDLHNSRSCRCLKDFTQVYTWTICWKISSR